MTVGRFKGVLFNQTRTSDEVFELLTSMRIKYEYTYLIAGQEQCPTTGNYHVDFYFEYPTTRRWTTENKKFVKTFGQGYGHLELARGTAGENLDYSSKEEGDFLSYGTPAPGQGFRQDLLQDRDDILSGKMTAEDICVANPARYHQYARTFHKLEDIALRKRFRTEMTEGIWYHGPTFTGKSHFAFSGYDPAIHYIWKNDNGWQDGYTGQDVCIINDFRGKIPYEELLTLVDKWPHFVSRRGREPAPFLASKVIITSSLSPDRIYHNRDVEDSLEQLYRRFTIKHVTEKIQL